ncbi:MAG: hypothetical protein AAF974_09180, partial [Cyanobacteria bacterium P01_E01_bin.34]
MTERIANKQASLENMSLATRNKTVKQQENLAARAGKSSQYVSSGPPSDSASPLKTLLVACWHLTESP